MSMENITAPAIWERRRIVAGMYLRGQTSTRRLAEVLGVSHDTIARDIRALHKEWRDSAFRAASELVAEQLAKLDELERFATTQLETSLRGNVATTTTTYPDGRSTTTTTTSVNARYLLDWWERWMRCVVERCRILGAGPSVQLIFGEDGGISFEDGDQVVAMDLNYDTWSVEQLRSEWVATRERIAAVNEANRIVSDGGTSGV